MGTRDSGTRSWHPHPPGTCQRDRLGTWTTMWQPRPPSICRRCTRHNPTPRRDRLTSGTSRRGTGRTLTRPGRRTMVSTCRPGNSCKSLPMWPQGCRSTSRADNLSIGHWKRLFLQLSICLPCILYMNWTEMTASRFPPGKRRIVHFLQVCRFLPRSLRSCLFRKDGQILHCTGSLTSLRRCMNMKHKLDSRCSQAHPCRCLTGTESTDLANL